MATLVSPKEEKADNSTASSIASVARVVGPTAGGVVVGGLLGPVGAVVGGLIGAAAGLVRNRELSAG
ncbi:MAG TPA: hypothetical protein VN783_11155 [Thermoanaerobaculia bacterium]|nr:hypothetical protein [Thermoanaerobaculia bacterium]